LTVKLHEFELKKVKLHKVKLVIVSSVIDVIIQPSCAATLAHVDVALGCEWVWRETAAAAAAATACECEAAQSGSGRHPLPSGELFSSFVYTLTAELARVTPCVLCKSAGLLGSGIFIPTSPPKCL
jgi:hypothetical protein